MGARLSAAVSLLRLDQVTGCDIPHGWDGRYLFVRSTEEGIMDSSWLVGLSHRNAGEKIRYSPLSHGVSNQRTHKKELTKAFENFLIRTPRIETDQVG